MRRFARIGIENENLRHDHSRSLLTNLDHSFFAYLIKNRNNDKQSYIFTIFLEVSIAHSPIKAHPSADEAEAVMEERVPIHKIHTIDGIVSPEGQPDGCVTCSEKTMSVCGWRVKRWCLLIALLILVTIGCLIPLVIYAVRFGEATSCRLTYTDNALVTEAEMQSWMSKESWPLSVPTYDWKHRTCVCKGFEDQDPRNLLPTDEVLVWIAPGDLVSLSDESLITPALDPAFVAAHRMHYNQDQHVKVCLRQQLVLDLWNVGYDVSDGGQHCHASSGDGSSNVEQFFLGWDGALYCGSAAIWKSQTKGKCTDPPVNERDKSMKRYCKGYCNEQDITKSGKLVSTAAYASPTFQPGPNRYYVNDVTIHSNQYWYNQYKTYTYFTLDYFRCNSEDWYLFSQYGDGCYIFTQGAATFGTLSSKLAGCNLRFSGCKKDQIAIACALQDHF